MRPQSCTSGRGVLWAKTRTSTEPCTIWPFFVGTRRACCRTLIRRWASRAKKTLCWSCSLPLKPTMGVFQRLASLRTGLWTRLGRLKPWRGRHGGRPIPHSLRSNSATLLRHDSLLLRGLALAPGRNVRVLAALALARTGDSAQAQRLADELNRE